MITEISLIIIAGLSSFLGAKLAFRNVKFKVQQDLSQPNTFKIVPDAQKRGKVEFIPDATSDELEEMQKEPKWRQFLNSFKKV